MWEDEHIERRELRQSMEREGREPAEVVDNPFYFRSMATHLDTPPEDLGESSDDVLAGLGYTGEEIAQLREEGVVE